MNGLEAVEAVGAVAARAQGQGVEGAASAPYASFAELMGRGVAHVENKINTANELVRAFAVDDSIPIHEVTIALEEARLAVEMALQVRTRLVEGYREIMNMQL